jgi:hypothetical protein
MRYQQNASPENNGCPKVYFRAAAHEPLPMLPEIARSEQSLHQATVQPHARLGFCQAMRADAGFSEC